MRYWTWVDESGKCATWKFNKHLLCFKASEENLQKVGL